MTALSILQILYASGFGFAIGGTFAGIVNKVVSLRSALVKPVVTDQQVVDRQKQQAIRVSPSSPIIVRGESPGKLMAHNGIGPQKPLMTTTSTAKDGGIGDCDWMGEIEYGEEEALTKDDLAFLRN